MTKLAATARPDGSTTSADALVRAVRVVVFDFDGVFTDNAVYVFEDGREAVRCTRADGIGLQRLARVGVTAIVLSTEVNPVVSARCRKLKVRCIQACEDKGVAIEALASELGVPLAAFAFVGNDVNDAPAFARVGLPVVVADAHPDVLPFARLRTRAAGGHGAVREFCDLVAAAREVAPSTQIDAAQSGAQSP